MKIIYHTASAEKSEKSFLEMLNSEADIIELDFNFTEDDVPIWSHYNRIGIRGIRKMQSQDSLLKDYLTLQQILELNNHKKPLLLDFKSIDENILRSETLKRLLKNINQYDDIMIQSLDKNLIRFLLESGNYDNIQKGLVINYFTSFLMNEKSAEPFKKLDFVSLASELWEVSRGYFLKRSEDYFPEAKRYAWTWELIYKETPKRLRNFLEQSADGIITVDPTKTQKVITNYPKKR